MRRFVGIGALTLSAVLASQAHAHAQVEFCPAAVTMTPVAAQAGAYSVVLSAGSQRSVWGSIVAKTTAGWYSMAFNNFQLTSHAEEYSTEFGQFQRFNFESPTLYVRFPRNVRVLSAFVNAGRAEGDAEFGWLEKGLVSCQSSEDRRVLRAGAPSNQTVSDVVTLLTPTVMPPAIPPGAKMLKPILSYEPGPTNCATPFADASIARLETAPYPVNVRGRSGRVLVAVAIDATGKLLDAWAWGSSGVNAFDAVAVHAARNTVFTPKRAFCQNVPSVNFLNISFRAP